MPIALPTSFKRAKSRGKTGSSRTSSLMRLAMESTHTARFTSAAEKNTFRSRQVKASTSSPMGMALRTISRGWALKWASTVRRALGWHHRASSVMHPASSTAATSEPHQGSWILEKRSRIFNVTKSFPEIQRISPIIVRLPRKSKKRAKKEIQMVFSDGKIPFVSRNGWECGNSTVRRVRQQERCGTIKLQNQQARSIPWIPKRQGN